MQIKKLVSMGSRTGRHLQRYNIEGCRQVVGCIPYRFRKSNQSPSGNGSHVEELEVLLISSQKSQRMMFPKGGWENDEAIEEAALRETFEEAGVDGIIGCKIGTWSFESSSQGKCNEGHMFPLLVTEELDVWPEQNVRQRTWMTIKEARIKCAHPWMKEALEVLIPSLVHLESKEETRAPCSLEFLSPRKVEETLTSCSLEFLLPRMEEQTGVQCSLPFLLPRKEEETPQLCLVQYFLTEDPRMGIVAHSGEEECLVS